MMDRIGKQQLISSQWTTAAGCCSSSPAGEAKPGADEQAVCLESDHTRPPSANKNHAVLHPVFSSFVHFLPGKSVV